MTQAKAKKVVKFIFTVAILIIVLLFIVIVIQTIQQRNMRNKIDNFNKKIELNQTQVEEIDI